MSTAPLSRSPDLELLREEGYEAFVQVGYLVVDNIPYVDSEKEIRRGRLVCELNLANGVTIKPETHVVLFSGSVPCNQDGTPIAGLGGGPAQSQLAEGLTVDRSFSSKPRPDGYRDFYEKMSTYSNILSGPAAALDPSVTARTYGFVERPDDDSPFVYVDTASSRARITAVMDKLRVQRVVIVGVGGSGSYILDFLAKTPIGQIDLYDGDHFRQHNAFRTPGAATLEEVGAGSMKADHFAAMYSSIHKKIISHPVRVDESNITELRGADFVFISIDRGAPKRLLIEQLEEFAVPFLDVGMGISEVDGSLGGLLRTTTSLAGSPTLGRGRIDLSDIEPDGDYVRNIQIADLNALNAALAVVRWKKALGFYRDLGREHHSLYVLDTNEHVNDDVG